jgi:hypothetical protein
MPQIGGKPKTKSSKTKSSKTKSSSTSKRHFTVVIGSKEHGLYCSSSPSSAARKAVSKLCGKEKGKKVEFCLREITQGSKKKTYGPYLGHVEKLAKPIELKGRVIERMPVARLKAKSSVKKGGMRGGGGNNNEGTEMSNLSNKIEEQFVNATAKRIYSGSLDWTSIKNNLEFKNIPRSRIGELQKIAQSKAQSMQLQLLHNRSSRK